MKKSSITNGQVKPIVINDSAPKDHAAAILTQLRQLEPEEQNMILNTVLREITFDRINKHKSSTLERDRHAKLADEFINIHHERYVKEFEEMENKRKN